MDIILKAEMNQPSKSELDSVEVIVPYSILKLSLGYRKYSIDADLSPNQVGVSVFLGNERRQ